MPTGCYTATSPSYDNKKEEGFFGQMKRWIKVNDKSMYIDVLITTIKFINHL